MSNGVLNIVIKQLLLFKTLFTNAKNISYSLHTTRFSWAEKVTAYNELNHNTDITMAKNENLVTPIFMKIEIFGLKNKYLVWQLLKRLNFKKANCAALH